MPLPTSMALKVLCFAKKESHRLTVAKCVTYNISLTLVNRIIKYDLQLKCMLVRCGCPLPSSRLIVPVLLVFFIRVFSLINISSFLRKHFTQACSSLTLAVSKLLIKYLSSTINPVVAEEIYIMLGLHYRYCRIFIYQFNNFCIGEI